MSIQEVKERTYLVKENAYVYYTRHMDQTLKWFENVLGWYGKVLDRDENGAGTYGFAADTPQEQATPAPYIGIHMWNGEPSERVVALVAVDNIAAFRNFVLRNGWQQISEIQASGASAKTCYVTTIDGSVLMVFE